MQKQPTIAAREFAILVFGLTVGTSILVTPSGLALTAREDAWFGAIVSTSINLLMVLLYIGLARLYPGKSLFEINTLVLGKWLGSLVSLHYLFFFLILAGTLLGNLGFFITSEIMPDTPIGVIQLLFLVAVVMCAHLGFHVLARLGEFLYPWILVLFGILVCTLLPQINIAYILPMFEKGLLPSLEAGLHSSMFQEIIVLMLFVPFVQDKPAMEKGYLVGTGLGGFLLMLIVLLSILILGIEQSANSTFPAYALAKTIKVGNFLQRIEGVLITIWILTFFLKTSLLFYGMLMGMQTTFKLRNYHPLIVPLAILVLLVAWTTYINTLYVAEIIQKVWVNYSMLNLVAVPLLLAVVGAIRSRVGTAKDEAGQQQ